MNQNGSISKVSHPVRPKVSGAKEVSFFITIYISQGIFLCGILFVGPFPNGESDDIQMAKYAKVLDQHNQSVLKCYPSRKWAPLHISISFVLSISNMIFFDTSDITVQN